MCVMSHAVNKGDHGNMPLCSQSSFLQGCDLRQNVTDEMLGGGTSSRALAYPCVPTTRAVFSQIVCAITTTLHRGLQELSEDSWGFSAMENLSYRNVQDHGRCLWRSELGRAQAIFGQAKRNRALVPTARFQFELLLAVSGVIRNRESEIHTMYPVVFGANVLPSGTLLRLTVDNGQVDLHVLNNDNPSVEAIEPSNLDEDVYSALKSSPRVSRALNILNERSCGYSSWVIDSVSRICLRACTDSNQVGSSSTIASPGSITMLESPRSARLLNMLVHEASHQYIYAASALVPLEHDSKTTEYSSLVGKSRPFSKLLLGYHAMGNCELMFLELLSNTSDSKDLDELRAELLFCRLHRENLQVVIDRIKARSGTDVGVALYESLSRRFA